MPRVPDELLNAVVFLYEDEEDAMRGEGAGGTGFVIEAEASDGLRFHGLVTNKHISGNLVHVVRANTAEGFEVLRVPPESWVDHPDGDDVSIAPLQLPDAWNVQPLDWDSVCPTGPMWERMNVGIGDDAVMIGRFLGHEGRESNQPLARFGNIALMPEERIEDGRGLLVEAYLVEMRSLPGFSGSPVFVYVAPTSYRGDATMTRPYVESIALIGIDTGHKQHTSSVFLKGTDTPIDATWVVRQNTGVAIVAPHWKITEVLEQDELRASSERV